MYRQIAQVHGAILLAVLVGMSGCALLPQPEIDTPTMAPPGLPAAPQGADTYLLENVALTIHTYRAGWLAGLAHSHTMTTDAVVGVIHYANPQQSSTAALYFRPFDLVLDDPDDRARAGAGFESVRSEADIEATRVRMLGPRGLASNEHPYVLVEASWRSQSELNLIIHLRGAAHQTIAPVSWRHDGEVIEAHSDVELSQRALGIKPYSAFLGAIAVADRVRVQLSLSARRADRL